MAEPHEYMSRWTLDAPASDSVKWGFWRNLQGAAEMTLSGVAIRGTLAKWAEPDPTWNPLSFDINGLEDYAEDFAETRSRQEAEQLRAYILRNDRTRAEMMRSGSWFPTLLAEIADPTMWVAPMRAARGVTVLAAGKSAVGQMAGIATVQEATRMQLDPTMSLPEGAFAVGGAMVFAGALGMAAHRMARGSFDTLAKRYFDGDTPEAQAREDDLAALGALRESARPVWGRKPAAGVDEPPPPAPAVFGESDRGMPAPANVNREPAERAADSAGAMAVPASQLPNYHVIADAMGIDRLMPRGINAYYDSMRNRANDNLVSETAQDLVAAPFTLKAAQENIPQQQSIETLVATNHLSRRDGLGYIDVQRRVRDFWLQMRGVDPAQAGGPITRRLRQGVMQAKDTVNSLRGQQVAMTFPEFQDQVGRAVFDQTAFRGAAPQVQAAATEMMKYFERYGRELDELGMTQSRRSMEIQSRRLTTSIERLDRLIAGKQRRMPDVRSPKRQLEMQGEVEQLEATKASYMADLDQIKARLDDPIMPENEPAYYHRMWRDDLIRARRKDFEEVLRRWFISQGEKPGPDLEARIQATVSSILRDNANELQTGMLSTSVLMARRLDIPNELVADFIETRADVVAWAYYRKVAAPIEMARRFGDAQMQARFDEIEQRFQAAHKAGDPNAIRNLNETLGFRPWEQIWALREELKKAYGTLSAVRAEADTAGFDWRNWEKQIEAIELGDNARPLNLADPKERWLSSMRAAEEDKELIYSLLKEKYHGDHKLGSLEILRDKVRGTYGQSTDPLDLTPRAINTIKQLVSLGLMGRAWMSAVGDTGRMVLDFGLRDTFVGMVKILNPASVVGKLSLRDRELAATAFELELGLRTAAIADIHHSNVRLSPFERGVQNLHSWFFVANGLAPWTLSMRRVAATIHMSKLGDALLADQAISEAQRTYLRRYGIGAQDEEILIEQLGRHSQVVDGMRIPNLEKWDRTPEVEAVVDKFRAAVHDAVNMSVPTPGQADRPDVMSKPLWSLILQFKAFAFMSHQRNLIAMAQQRDRNAVAAAMSMVALGYMAGELRQWGGLVPSDTKQRYEPAIEEKILRAIELSGATSIFLDLNNIIENVSMHNVGVRPLLGMRAPFGEPDGVRGTAAGIGELSGPGIGMPLETLASVYSGDVGGAVRGVRYMLPLNNLWIWNGFMKDMQLNVTEALK